MERIDRGYAIIYIDREGLTLDTDMYFTEEMTTDYYQNHGLLQWNFYLIIPEERLKEKFINNEVVKEFQIGHLSHLEKEQAIRKLVNAKIKEIESNDSFSRKYVMAEENIEELVDAYFPILNPEKKGQVIVIKGENWSDAQSKIHKLCADEQYNSWMRIPSHYRDNSMLDTLEFLDRIRAQLIEEPEIKIIFFTHIRREYNLAKNKFNPFLIDPHEKRPA